MGNRNFMSDFIHFTTRPMYRGFSEREVISLAICPQICFYNISYSVPLGCKVWGVIPSPPPPIDAHDVC